MRTKMICLDLTMAMALIVADTSSGYGQSSTFSEMTLQVKPRPRDLDRPILRRHCGLLIDPAAAGGVVVFHT